MQCAMMSLLRLMTPCTSWSCTSVHCKKFLNYSLGIMTFDLTTHRIIWYDDVSLFDLILPWTFALIKLYFLFSYLFSDVWVLMVWPAKTKQPFVIILLIYTGYTDFHSCDGQTDWVEPSQKLICALGVFRNKDVFAIYSFRRRWTEWYIGCLKLGLTILNLSNF